MFKAVIKGKSGSVRSDIENKTIEPKRIGFEIPSIREDVLTAAIFTRLSYLPAAKFWDILCRLYPVLPYRELVILKNIEFWPYWRHPGKDRKSVEPDIFLQFEVGDPKTSIDLLIEIKRYENWTPQSFQQHIDQISGYYTNMDDAFDSGNSLFFLALGGLGNQPKSQMKLLEEHVIPGVKDVSESEFSKSHIGGTSWKKLSGVISNCLVEWDEPNKFILNDLIEILNHAGFTNRRYFADKQPIELFNYQHASLASLYNKAD